MIDKFEGRWRFLSNFYPCRIEHKGIVYPSVEHYYVAMKVTEMQLLDGRYYTAADFREMIARIPVAAATPTVRYLTGSDAASNFPKAASTKTPMSKSVGAI